MIDYCTTFISAMLAGFCIGFGGIAYLSVDNTIIGAALFTIGLFVICTFGLNLFTGMVPYLFDSAFDGNPDRKYPAKVIITWLGNLSGTAVLAALVRETRLDITERAETICQMKLHDTVFSVYLLAIFCGIMIYIAVEGFRHNETAIGKYLSLFFGVMVFIICGYEHCVADMFYFFLSGEVNQGAVICIIFTTIGNLFGGIIAHLLHYTIKFLKDWERDDDDADQDTGSDGSR